MGKVIGPPIKTADKEWILAQQIFFHATAPLSANGHVNLSPKCAREFRVIDDRTVAWLDLTGSGSETCAHVLENGRLTILFVALSGSPRILRLHGYARIVPVRDFCHKMNGDVLAAFNEYLHTDTAASLGARCIVVLDVRRVSQSCGYSIPKYDFDAYRTTLDDVTVDKGCEGIQKYRTLKNSYSIDGLPSIAQLELGPSGSAPTAVEWKDGYIYTPEYGTGWWENACVRTSVAWRCRAMWWSWRDLAMVGCGVVIGGVAVRLLSKRASLHV
jgi:hypothetical protein